MKDLILPDPLAEHYELVSCLKYSEQASTCLIAVRSSGKTVLLKTASDPLLSKSLLQEKMVLEMIHQTDSPFAASFPAPIARITVAAPVTASPPANTPSREV